MTQMQLRISTARKSGCSFQTDLPKRSLSRLFGYHVYTRAPSIFLSLLTTLRYARRLKYSINLAYRRMTYTGTQRRKHELEIPKAQDR